ncbi:RNA-metabolising metallo-beta-lactamase [Halothece sp. PCC 7418]|uniref:ribonuclease J n=1 Tax=Halothece sp. (strain PCC 7418) TaxID=65093 RepID=UPI0002A073B9|nr:ribonuclease J [Halothece sp. PCC 7418]AFZ45486.1 RNA-metabolising metallo-beta-lactamase [Halothece sp. PCC 7418]
MSKNEAQPNLRIIPLGGLHEIGKNTCIIEYGDEMILLDAGIGFPSEDMHGINVVLPDMTYLRENRHKIKGMIVTHGHEDHIGGIVYHLKQFDIPVIYGPRLALALLQNKLEEAGIADQTTLKSVLPRDVVKLGSAFSVEYIRNTHSIADSCCVAITTPLGVVIHTGDFKIDHTPVDGEHFDLHRLAEYGAKGVLCLLSDSTNAEVPGHTPSENSVRPNLDRVFAEADGRLLVTTFASSVHRVRIILELAEKHNRVVGVVGRSMLNVIAHARNLGYIKCPDNLFVSLKELNKVPDERSVILTTGSQGEPLAAMTRISKGEHRQIKIRENDTVVFSANPIPGNTIAVVNTIDRLMMLGAKVVYGRHQGIHVSGHGSQEDHKLMLALTKPKFFVPFHGEHRMLVKHGEMAQAMGIPKENMVIINNGDVVEVSRDRIEVTEKVQSGIELVDHSGLVHKDIMTERQQLALDGLITVAVAVGTDGKVLAQPEVNLRGVVSPLGQTKINELIIRSVEQSIKNYWSNLATNGNGKPIDTNIDWSELKIEIEGGLKRLVRRELKSQPATVCLLQTPQEKDGKVKNNGNGKTAPIIKNKDNGNNGTNGKQDFQGRRRRRRSAATVSSQ